ncbi:MAG: hypothetical protein ACI4D9_00365 [Lachnospiraceae bacterium]
MNVSDAVKKQYRDNSIHKNLILKFPELDLQIRHEDMHQDTMRLSESVLDKDSIEFVGCIASIYQISVENLTADVKGKKIEVEIYTDSQEESIPLFHGIVDSAVRQANTKTKEIIAYDELYTKGNTEVSGWYKSLTFPITLKNLRDSLFSYIGIEQETTDLPNDYVEINRQYDPESLQALMVIKAVCQINGAFGIINRQGKFEYRILTGKIECCPYPSVTLFPSGNLFPTDPTLQSSNVVQPESFSFYKKVSYEEYKVKPVDKVTIRSSEDSTGVTYSSGDGDNNYIVQGNMFAYGLDNNTLLRIAENIYNNVKEFSYYPFQADNNGLPFIECCDAVEYTMIDYDNSTDEKLEYEQKIFYVLNRELTGIQALRDSYSAEGEEYQTEFITDLQTQIDTIKNSVKEEVEEQLNDYTYSRDEIDNMLGETGSGLKILSVAELPEIIDENTVYLIQGEVTVT